jgi:uncharacterized protein DUF5947
MASGELIMTDGLSLVEAGRMASEAHALSGAPSSREARCDFCGGDIDNPHTHLFDRPRRSLVCVCSSCYCLFTHDGAGGTRFRAVPRRYVLLPNLANAAALWDALRIPIGLSFLFTNGATGLASAFCPSPAGATEAGLPLDVWRDVERAMPLLATMVHDVEALLVRRTDTLVDAAIVPVDACYELVGRICQAWRGLQRDDDVSREIEVFFARVTEMARAPAL